MSLTPLTSNLGISRAKHLLRRACFHYNKNLLYTISELNSEQAVGYPSQNKSHFASTDVYNTGNQVNL